MKFMQVYSKIYEFNRSDKNLVKSISNQFTISLEIEIETSDKEKKYTIPKSKFLKIVKKSVYTFIKDNNEDIKEINNISSLLSDIDLTEDYDEDYNYDVFNNYIDLAKTKFQKDLYSLVYSEYLTYWCSDNIEYLTNKVEENLPNFYNKWSSSLKFELDNTLERGIEFSPKLYLVGIEKTLEYINDFYNDFKTQDYWYMSDKTGIHVNIGLINKNHWNILKGMLMISDIGEYSYIFKDMKWRLKSHYTNSFLPKLKEEIKSDKKILNIKLFSDISKIENVLSKYILSKLDNNEYKNYGFNITRIRNMNYVEFRYPGGEIKKDSLINKVYYFCYIVKLMTDPDFKRKKYLKNLYKFISNL